MRNSWGITLFAAAVLSVVLGTAGFSVAAEKQQGSFWYAVDNISDVEEDARILVWVTLPPEWHGQSVQASNITPEPVAILEDPVSGNRIIEWMVEPPARQADPGTSPTYHFFHYDFELEQKPLHFEIDPAAIEPFDKSTPLYRQYTMTETWIQTGGKVLDLARDIVGQERNPWLQGGLIYDWLVKNLTFVPGGTESRDAISTLTGLTGDCSQFSVMFTALCRSIGIPARTVTSTWLDGGGHVFAELYLPGYGWVPVVFWEPGRRSHYHGGG